MKKLIVLFAFCIMAFGYNFNGTWINAHKNQAKFNDPIKIVIKNGIVTPFIKRSGTKIAKLKPKYATNSQSALFEAWGFNNKNLVLLIQPINSAKIKVIAKKINIAKRKIVTKNFIFIRKNFITLNKKRAFVGTWVNHNIFSAISRMQISLYNQELLIKAWRPLRRGEEYLGAAVAKISGNKLTIRWHRGNLYVNATIFGQRYYNKRYHQLKMYLKATNQYTGISNEQTIIFKRSHPAPIFRDNFHHIKIGPIDLNLLINSY